MNDKKKSFLERFIAQIGPLGVTRKTSDLEFCKLYMERLIYECPNNVLAMHTLSTGPVYSVNHYSQKHQLDDVDNKNRTLSVYN